MPRFSVVIPTRDDPLVHEAIESVLEQSLHDLEVIVVDDGSSPPVVLTTDDPRVRLVRNHVSVGPAGARNMGIEQARGVYVAFLDSDDLYLPRRLEAAARGHELGAVVLCEGTHDEISRPHMLKDPAVLLRRTTPHLGVVSVERSLILFFDERFLASQDVEWWIRVVQSGLPVACVPHRGWRWRRGEHRRVLNGPSARLAFSYELLRVHAEYFEADKHATAFRWTRIAAMERREGSLALGRRAIWASLKARPTRLAFKEGLRLIGAAVRELVRPAPPTRLSTRPMPPIPPQRAASYRPHRRGPAETRIQLRASVPRLAFWATTGLPRAVRGRVRRLSTLRCPSPLVASTPFGAFSAPANDTRVLAPYFFEPLESAALSRLAQEGDLAVDLGANLGWYAGLLAERVGESGRVVAVEADPTLRPYLETVVEEGGFQGRIDVRSVAVSLAGDEVDLITSGPSQLNHVRMGDEPLAGPGVVRVPALRIATLLDEVGAPDIAKIDLEGLDGAVLAEMLDWVEQRRVPYPVVMVEFDPAHSLRYGVDLEALLTRLVAIYALVQFDAASGAIRPVRSLHELVGRNLFALPLERVGELVPRLQLGAELDR